MAAYEPNPLNDTQPEDDVFASTAAAEFRALKTVIAAYAAGINYLGEWSAQVGACPKGAFVTHNDAMWMAKVLLANIATVEPSDVNSATWFKFVQLTPGGYVAKTGNSGSAAMPSGTTAQRDVAPAVGYARWNSTLGTNETWNGTDWVPDGWVALGSVSTASGTGGIIGGIPPWITELKLVLKGVSGSTTGSWTRVRLGTALGMVTTGYVSTRWFGNTGSASVGGTSTAGFDIHTETTLVARGALHLHKLPGTETWVAYGMFGDSGAPGAGLTGGEVTLPQALTQVEVLVAIGAFDAGSVVLFGKR